MRERFGEDLPLVDLDVAADAPDSGLLPRATCRIIANIVDNAAELGGQACSRRSRGRRGQVRPRQARRVDTQGVWASRYSSRGSPRRNSRSRELVWSTGRGPLPDRIDRMMETIVDPSRPAILRKNVSLHTASGEFLRTISGCSSSFPRRHTYMAGSGAWRREGRPISNSNAWSMSAIPTVFFHQSFCAKQDLAHNLAERYGGIAVDCHREINDSILAKVEAFIKLS